MRWGDGRGDGTKGRERKKKNGKGWGKKHGQQGDEYARKQGEEEMNEDRSMERKG